MFGLNQVTPQTGEPTSVLANLNGVRWHPGGLTIDWSTVAALGSDVVDPDGSRRVAGGKSVRYGQVLTQISKAEVNTITVGASGGTYTLTVNGQTTGNLAFNANAAAIQAALVALSTVGAGNATVTGTGPYTVTFTATVGDVAMTVAVGSLTGGSASVATVFDGASTKKWGPYDPSATDGRQNLGRGMTVIVEKTIHQLDNLGLDLTDRNVIGAIEGGTVWRKRLIATNSTHSLAAGPTFAELEAVFPMLRYAGSGF